MPKDRHYRQAYDCGPFTVWGTSLDSPKRRAQRALALPADFGLYLDSRWWTESDAREACFIDWPTLEAPTSPATFRESLFQLVAVGLAGKTIEVGCFGGHGRTGTVLAALSVLFGVSPEAAIERVRSNYCSFAIGAVDLEAFIHSLPDLLHSEWA